MTLSTRLASYFSKNSRHRGEQIYDGDLVRITGGSATEVAARVQGSQLYEVELAWQEGMLNGRCDCPYFDDAGACKHLWATILADYPSLERDDILAAIDYAAYQTDHVVLRTS